MSLELDPRTLAMMEEAYAPHEVCGCGRQAQRVRHRVFYCRGCYEQKHPLGGPVEVRTSGDPHISVLGRGWR